MNNPIHYIKYFFFGAILFSFSNAFAQNKEVLKLDSIEIELKYDTLHSLYRKKQYDKAAIYGGKALQEIETSKASNLKRYLKIVRRLGDVEMKNYHFDDAKKYYDQGLKIAIKHLGESSAQYANSQDDFGSYYTKLADFEKAYDHFKKASTVVVGLFGKESYKAGLSYLKMADPMARMGNHLDAEHLYHKTLRCYTLNGAKGNRLEELYYKLARLNALMRNYDRTIDLAQKALALCLNRKKPSVSAEVNIRIVLAKALRYKDPRSGVKMYQEILKMYEEKSNKSQIVVANIYKQLGDTYFYLKEYKKAKVQYEQVIRLRKLFKYNSPYFDLYAKLSLGKVTKKLAPKAEVIRFYNQLWTEYGTEPKILPRAKAKLLNDISILYYNIGDLDTALQINTRAIQFIDRSFDPKNFEKTSYEYANNNITLQSSFQNRTKFLRKIYFDESENIDDLELSLVFNEVTIDLMEDGLKNDFAKFDLDQVENQKTYNYINAVFKAHKLYELTQDEKYLEIAFNYAERNKAFTLKQGIANNIALSETDIPKNIKDSINRLESKIDSMQIAFENPRTKESIKERLQNDILGKKLAYENLIGDLEEYNPEYYNLKYKTFNLDLQRIKNKSISSNSILIEYFYNNEHIYIFTIKDAQINLIRKELTIDLDSIIQDLRNKDLGNIVLNLNQTKSYISGINKLHDLLISPIEEVLDSTKKIVIVPHGILQNLPFEMLTKDNGSKDYRKLDYLIKIYNIQYAYSAELWAKESRAGKQNEIAFSGFAPMFEKMEVDTSNKNLYAAFRSEYGSLLYSKKEIEKANNIFNGEIFIGEEASESKFLEQAPKSNIIHIASHTIANDKNPKQSVILFSDKNDEERDALLNLSEIYSLNLNADLAVMSACNTGAGKVKQGEGVMSIGRAFLFAGCKSVIMNLWLANDESSSQIMQSFYKYTSKKMHKDEALRQAKLDYLNNADALTAHPYFWANMVAVGDMSPLETRSNYWKLWLGLAVGTFALFGLYYRRRKFSSLPIGSQV
jgi:CHAT domain-containing protein/tetratricopeptide (TPR) repeat protein